MKLIDVIIAKMKLTATRERIVRNLFWSVLGKVVSLAGSLLVGIVIARYLGPEQYGMMNYVISYVFLFRVLSVFGLDSIEVREEAKGEVPFQQVLGTAFRLRLWLSLITIALCIGTSLMYEPDSTTTCLVAVYALSILPNTLSVIRNYFTALVQNEYVVKSEITRTLLGMTIKLALLWMRASLFWFVVASAFDTVLLASGYVLAYRKKIGRLRDWSFDRRYAFYLLRESFPLLLTGTAVIIYQRIDQVMIGSMLDKTAVGYFSTAARFVELMIFVPMMLSQTIAPILVGIRQRSEEDYRKKAQLFMNFTVWVSFILAALVSVLSYWIVLYTFGERYLPAVAILQVLAFKVPSVALSTTAGQMIVLEGLQRWVVVRDCLGCLVCIGLNYYLLPRYGVMAAAFVAILSNVAAGYLADMIIPRYWHVFVHQTRALLLGWLDILHVKRLFSSDNGL